ncbi:hypothetical protein [Pseudomonas saudiphocaensis]|uniref:hypothetical protein n=1 Tax=Pseudomonas saudiphocaensis TaxID=1499686 RepID=UPI000F777C5E|nr:hypothetical protein [Pseudomonas saudiphocaensis]
MDNLLMTGCKSATARVSEIWPFTEQSSFRVPDKPIKPLINQAFRAFSVKRQVAIRLRLSSPKLCPFQVENSVDNSGNNPSDSDGCCACRGWSFFNQRRYIFIAQSSRCNLRMFGEPIDHSPQQASRMRETS